METLTPLEIDALSRIASEDFGVEVARIEPLPGELDRNVAVTDAGGVRTILKVFTSNMPRAAIAFQRDLLDHAAERDPSLVGSIPRFLGAPEAIRRVRLADREVDAALLEHLDGRALARVTPHTPELLRSVGALVARFDRAVQDFTGAPPPSTDGSTPLWPLLLGRATIADRIDAIPAGPKRRALIEEIAARFDDATVERLGSLRPQVLHQDANDYNVLVRVTRDGAEVAGLIDLGDATRGPLVGDVAIAAAYAALGKRDPVSAMAHVVAGYHAEHALDDEEIAAVFDLALLRLATSVAVSAQRAATSAASEYHLVTEAPAWDALESLADVHPRLATAVLRDAAGLDPVPRAKRFAAWARSKTFEPIVGAPLSDAPRVDLSIDGTLLVEGARDRTFDEWGAAIETLRLDAGAPAAVGYHDETRLLYRSDAFAVEREDGLEPRTVHLGVDLFAPAGTEIRAPLGGIVRSVQRNGAPLDYGPTVILDHDDEDGGAFSTLYGHLDGEVLTRLRAGERIEAGDMVGRLGGEHENGGWPPHLHFQVVLDPLDRVGDFPGVAAPGWRRAWTALCPDPAVLLGLESCDANEPRTAALLAERRAAFCRSMSIHYESRPLQIVKGRGTTLYDAEGRAFLDAVNNVPHVGHCHPRVVEAGQRQMALLNTNTRYLDEQLCRYAEKLRSRLPDHLEVLYFVCSGSEANELALRIARAATDGARDVLVQEHGYHGHTGATVAMSHYKFARAGGFEPGDEVHVVPLADPYRGIHRGSESGNAYANEVERILEALARDDRRPYAMIAEAIVGCGGQVVPPEGYLRRAFDLVRAAGGVAIADEVQVGFGRVGTHFWAFDEQGAVPDIVTMGKPMGNGHPIAAVATTRAIADRFAGGMEFFATFGGNNVSTAIGEAVLDVLEDERLMENARDVGAVFFAEMQAVAARHPIVGDVRGRGLYLGVDLVEDPETREPAGNAARYVAL
ncbi:MAG: aminotransferase class III-fold pyridoxal phosphate-dependent enzyme, partial [Planctomycetota bacterium]